MRFVQLTPPGSACSIAHRQGHHRGRARLRPGHADGRRRHQCRTCRTAGRGVEVERGPGVPVGGLRLLRAIPTATAGPCRSCRRAASAAPALLSLPGVGQAGLRTSSPRLAWSRAHLDRAQALAPDHRARCTCPGPPRRPSRMPGLVEHHVEVVVVAKCGEDLAGDPEGKAVRGDRPRRRRAMRARGGRASSDDTVKGTGSPARRAPRPAPRSARRAQRGGRRRAGARPSARRGSPPGTRARRAGACHRLRHGRRPPRRVRRRRARRGGRRHAPRRAPRQAPQGAPGRARLAAPVLPHPPAGRPTSSLM